MPKRSSKQPDREVADGAIGDALRSLSGQDGLTPEQIAARLLGARGGKKGGPARAAKLSAKRRTEIAKQAAAKRWAKKAS